jgi:hypothetical protein
MRRALLCASMIMAACSRGSGTPATTARSPAGDAAAKPPTVAACAADELGPLDRRKLYRDCHETEDECRAACDRDDVEACFGLAIVMQEREKALPEREAGAHTAPSNTLYRKACLLGAPNACTNHAAHLWRFSPSPDDLACASRIFEATCEDDDPFGCGMVARILVENATSADDEDVDRGRALLERSCAQLGNFPCHILALYFEQGRLGPVPEGRIDELMKKACDGGDTSACGEHASVEDSFGP